MPLYFTWECLKCKINGKQNLWAISNNHKYSDEKYFCPHFNSYDLIKCSITHLNFSVLTKQLTFCIFKTTIAKFTSKYFNRRNVKYIIFL